MFQGSYLLDKGPDFGGLFCPYVGTSSAKKYTFDKGTLLSEHQHS
jgi:hypothetical protein